MSFLFERSLLVMQNAKLSAQMIILANKTVKPLEASRPENPESLAFQLSKGKERERN